LRLEAISVACNVGCARRNLGCVIPTRSSRIRSCIQNGGVERMSEMSSILGILRVTDDSSRNEPNERGERLFGKPACDAPSAHPSTPTGRNRKSSCPERQSPFSIRLVARGASRSSRMFSMLLMPLMRMTPPFWMPERRGQTSLRRSSTGTIPIARLSARDQHPRPTLGSDTWRGSRRKPAGNSGRSTKGC
jgi:hypothetical protein